MISVYGFSGAVRTVLFLSLIPVLFFPKPAAAVAIDLLGEAASPIFGGAKEKLKGMTRYVWIEPYGGYATGDSDQKRVSSTGAVTVANGLKVDGMMYGIRGGFMVMNSIRVGLDLTVQSAKRNTLVETPTGTYAEVPVSGKSSMMGATFGFDVPFTPLQGKLTKYFKATIRGDGASSGDGFGYGVSFVLKNPFIFILESRRLNYTSAVDVTGKKADATVSQYYAALSFMLF